MKMPVTIVGTPFRTSRKYLIVDALLEPANSFV